MNREEARYYLQSSGFSEEQINTIEQAFKQKPTDDATLRDIFCMGCEYKEQVPCSDAIDRKLVCAFIAGLISDDEERKKGLEYIRSMPPVTPQPSISRPDIEAIRQEIETEMNLCRMKDTVSKGYKGKILEEVLGKIDKYIQKPQKEPCEDAISRTEAVRVASGYCHPANVTKELAKLPSVNPQPCEDAISRQAAIDARCNR